MGGGRGVTEVGLECGGGAGRLTKMKIMDKYFYSWLGWMWLYICILYINANILSTSFTIFNFKINLLSE